MSQVSLGVSLLSVNKVRELGRVPQKEDGCVVGDQIPVTILGLELYRESTRVSRIVTGTTLSSDGRESDCQGTLGTLFKHGGETEVFESVCTLPDTMSTSSLGVNDSLRNSLSVEMGEKVDQVEILEQKRSIDTDSLGLVRMRHGDAIGGGVDAVLGLGMTVSLVGGELGVGDRALASTILLQLVEIGGRVVAHGVCVCVSEEV